MVKEKYSKIRIFPRTKRTFFPTSFKQNHLSLKKKKELDKDFSLLFNTYSKCIMRQGTAWMGRK